ncbi:MAG: hypothetical protein FWC00_04960 [Firmicutes bacterium]|nr:hypothetical protein [Bacillota bacterium]
MKQGTDNSSIVKEVTDDFLYRKDARRFLELQWQLNIDFLNGRQNNHITNTESVANLGRRFWWQENQVFNHISPLIESRLVRLAESETRVVVVPTSSDEKDREKAEKCEKILRATFKRLDMQSLADQANMWAEITGTAFYKVVWTADGGKVIGNIDGKDIKEGDVQIIVASPFEVYIDNLARREMNNNTSIIHAKAMPVDLIQRTWGVTVAGRDVESANQGVMKNAELVIERYKNGELLIVAGEKLLYHGVYDVLPFVRQTAESVPGNFYGTSVIERVIPVQRAYNSVKNRKAEFLKRLACGVLAIEDGSVDVEALENDGLAPGTILTFRAGTRAPSFLDSTTVPTSLEAEEERLLSEFCSITGGSDLVRGARMNISGVALNILVEQDRLRIRRSIRSLQNAHVKVATKVLNLFKKHAKNERLEKLSNGKNVEIFTFSSDDISSDQVEIEVTNE